MCVMERRKEDFSAKLSPYIPEGMTVQGCIEYPLFVPYRVTTSDKRGLAMEWTLEDVIDWTTYLIGDHPELQDWLAPASRSLYEIEIHGSEKLN